MKKLSFLLLLTLMGLFTFAQNKEIKLRATDEAKCTQNDMNSMKAEFAFGTIKSLEVDTKMGKFSVLDMANTYESGNVGEPSLPAVHELIAVPFGATPRVAITNFSVEEYNLNEMGINKLMPRQPSVRKDKNLDEVEFVYNEEAYQRRGFAAAPEAEIEVTGTMRGVRVGSLTINNVSYDAAANKLRIFNNIEVEVTFEGADAKTTEDMLVSTYSPYFAPVYKQFFNSRAINDVYDDHPDLWAAPVRMIVVTPSNLRDALEPWLQWKTQKGFYVDVYTTEQTGTTNTAIKTYLQNLYNTGVQSGETPTFVVVVGDTQQVPASMPSGSQTQRATDLYYSSYDNDYFPDVFYSRMSATTPTHVSNMVNKILTYEKYTMADPSYLSNALLIAGWDPTWNPKVAQPTINYATINYFNTAHGYANVYAYLTQGQYSGCYNNLNTGVGFVNYTAHGGETSWSDPEFTNSDVNALTNNGKYFWAIGNCCNSGDFGYGECFGEAMIRGANKGAFSFIGSCPYSYWNEDYYFSIGATNTYYTAPSYASTKTGAYDGMFMDDTYNTVNSTLFLGNIAVTYASTNGYQYAVGPNYYWQAYHVLGDGSVMPYNVNPAVNNVTHATTFPQGASSFTVTADAGSYVAISQNDVLLGTALVGSTGSVNVPVTAPQSGEVMIVVTRQQRRPYIINIPVTSGGGTPNIELSSVNPTRIVANSNTDIEVTIINNGTASTTGNTTVTLSTTDTYLNIVNSSASYAPMNVNQSLSNTFVVKAAANTPNGHTVTVNLNAVNGSNTWQDSFTLHISNPCNIPNNLTATADGTNIHISWTASSTALRYKLYRGTTLIATQTATSYDDNNLNYSQEYCYSVVSVCNVGESNHTIEACATTDDEPCYVPENLQTSFDVNNVTLTWESADNANSYIIKRNGVVIAENITETTYHDNGLAIGTYCYTVASVCSATQSDYSDESCVTIEYDGIEEYEKSFQIVPNPADNQLNIITDENIIEASIFNITGVSVFYSNQLNDNVIRLDNFVKGMYFIKITTERGEVIKRFIKK